MIIINIILAVKKTPKGLSRFLRQLFHGDGSGFKIFKIHANLRDCSDSCL